MSPEPRYRRKESIICRRIAEESILVPACGRASQMQKVFILNPLALFIWQQLEHSRSLGDIATNMIGQFDVSNQQASVDAAELLSLLVEEDLVEVVT